MANDDEEEAGPIVELGESARVEGMPLARVSSRQTWGIEKSRLVEREADTEIRTPDGPTRLGDVLDSIDTVYFARRQDFEDEVTNVVGTGPVPTTDSEGDASDDGNTETDSDSDTEADDAEGDETNEDIQDNADANTDAEDEDE